MTVVTLRPQTPYYYDARLVGADINYIHPATQVGTGAVWADDSDTSYVDVDEEFHDGGEDSATLSADIPPVGVPGATLNSIRLRVRGMYLEDRNVNALLLFSEAGTTRLITSPTIPWMTARPLSPETVEWEPGTLWDESILTTGFRVTMYADSSSVGLKQAWRCHEIALIVDYNAPNARPYGQVFPRDDGRGAGAPGQIWPPATSRQTPGRGNGYY